MEREGPGNRAIDGVGLAAFAKKRAAGMHSLRQGPPVTSVRNAFPGIVTRVTLDEVAAQVEVQSVPRSPRA
jgi:hypothetical protein